MIHTVVHYTDSNGFGGAERVMLQVLGGLDRARWRPVLLHHGKPALARLVAAARNLGVELRELPPVSGLRHLGHWPGFVRTLRAERTAVFHAHLPAPLVGRYAIMAAAVARVPAVVATAHLVNDAALSLRARVIQTLAARCTNRYIAVSAGVARRLRVRLGIPDYKIRVIRNGIDVGRPSTPVSSHVRDEVAGQSRDPIVLTVARLDAQKGLVHLLAAAAQIPAARFVIVGEGRERAPLEARAQALGLAGRVRFLGHRDDVPELLAACDLFVLPSLYEGLPLSVLEAMAAARPVIATAIEGTDEAVVHGTTGLLVPPADPVALAGGIHMLLANRELARRMGEAGRTRVCSEFSIRRMIDDLTGTYDELLEQSERRRAR